MLQKEINYKEAIAIIQTERLHLKIYNAELLHKMFLYEKEATIRNLLGISTDRAYAKYKAKCLLGGNEFLSFRFFMLHDKITDELVGNCSFHRWLQEHSRAEIGYMMNEQFRNIGYMKEAMSAILKHGFDEMQLHRVEAFISSENTPSLRLVNHFGFQKEGVMREHYFNNNKLDDSICFSLLRSEYDPEK